MAAILTAIAGALDYAHKQGLLHRDVKPANIMLTNASEEADQRILLADFGIARSADDVSGLITTNMTVGTVAYSAPEQLMGEPLDGRADQYARSPICHLAIPPESCSRRINSPIGRMVTGSAWADIGAHHAAKGRFLRVGHHLADGGRHDASVGK